MDQEIKQYVQAGKKNLTMLYILNLYGIVAPLLTLVSGIFAFINKDVADKYLATHYTFLLRTFFVGLFARFITEMIYFVPIIYIVFVTWFLLRIIFGFKYLQKDIAHPNCKTFWVK